MSYIFINSLGISELLSRILAAAGSLDYLLFACLAYFVIERYGRRKVGSVWVCSVFCAHALQVMMCSAAACSICWIVIAAAQGQTETGGNSYKLGIVAVSFFFVFFASFGMGVLGVPWLYPTEYVPKISSDLKWADMTKNQCSWDANQRRIVGDEYKL